MKVFYVVMFYRTFKTRTVPLRKQSLLSSVAFTLIFKNVSSESSIPVVDNLGVL